MADNSWAGTYYFYKGHDAQNRLATVDSYRQALHLMQKLREDGMNHGKKNPDALRQHCCCIVSIENKNQFNYYATMCQIANGQPIKFDRKRIEEAKQLGSNYENREWELEEDLVTFAEFFERNLHADGKTIFASYVDRFNGDTPNEEFYKWFEISPVGQIRARHQDNVLSYTAYKGLEEWANKNHPRLKKPIEEIRYNVSGASGQLSMGDVKQLENGDQQSIVNPNRKQLPSRVVPQLEAGDNLSLTEVKSSDESTHWDVINTFYGTPDAQMRPMVKYENRNKTGSKDPMAFRVQIDQSKTYRIPLHTNDEIYEWVIECTVDSMLTTCKCLHGSGTSYDLCRFNAPIVCVAHAVRINDNGVNVHYLLVCVSNSTYEIRKVINDVLSQDGSQLMDVQKFSTAVDHPLDMGFLLRNGDLMLYQLHSRNRLDLKFQPQKHAALSIWGRKVCVSTQVADITTKQIGPLPREYRMVAMCSTSNDVAGIDLKGNLYVGDTHVAGPRSLSLIFKENLPLDELWWWQQKVDMEDGKDEIYNFFALTNQRNVLLRDVNAKHRPAFLVPVKQEHVCAYRLSEQILMSQFGDVLMSKDFKLQYLPEEFTSLILK